MLAELQVRRQITLMSAARRPRPRTRPREIRFPSAIAAAYYADQRRAIEEAEGLVKARAPELKAAMASVTRDMPGARTDDTDQMERVLADIHAAIGDVFDSDTLARQVLNYARRVAYHHAQGFVGQMEDLGQLGVSLSSEPWLESHLSTYLRSNVKLIKSLGGAYSDRVEKAAWRTVSQGQRWEDFARELREATGASKRQAALIARDQTGKLMGQLNQARQVEAGFDEYEWYDSRDERVRKSHRSLHGTIQRWSKPPIVRYVKGLPMRAHPGEDVNCRCAALPHIREAA